MPLRTTLKTIQDFPKELTLRSHDIYLTPGQIYKNPESHVKKLDELNMS